MMKINFIIVILNCFYSTFAEQSLQCGDWDAYKDEKCFKVFDKKELKNYLDAKNTCYQNEGSVLVSIRSQEEQEFVYNLLHNVHKILNDVWIGGQYSDKMFKWSDNATVNYTNWFNNFPRNETGYDCVQMSMDSAFNGKWLNEPCDKINVVVCQKSQNWSFSYLQKTVMDLRETMENMTIHFESELTKTKSELESTKNELKKVNQKATEATPAGTIAYFSNTNAPIGWLKANGQLVSRTTYANLFSIIGINFGSGDGNTTFTLPDLRGEFIRSWSDGRDIDKSRAFGSFQWGSNIPQMIRVNSMSNIIGAIDYQSLWAFSGSTFDDGFENEITSGQSRDGTTFPNMTGNGCDGINRMAYVSTSLCGQITHWNLLKGTRPRNIALLACIKY